MRRASLPARLRVVGKLFPLSMLLCGTLAFAEPDDQPDQQFGSEYRDLRPAPPAETIVDAGFVFVNGRYVAPPYRMRWTDSQVYINERPLRLSSFDLPSDRRGRRGGSGGQPGRRVVRELSDALLGDGCVVAFAERPVAMLYRSASYEFLRVLIGEASPPTSPDEPLWLPTSADRRQWAGWIDGFDCPPLLRERANLFITRSDEQLGEHYTKVRADRTLAAMAYPLTVVGMVLVAMSFGHVLSYRPGLEGDAAPTPSLHEQRGFKRALTLVAALSTLDVVWTILVSRTGEMKELNPLGAALIEDPLSLIVFKASATFVAIAILFALRQHHAARRGAWWGCLICTLLTVRWLTFNSMFVN